MLQRYKFIGGRYHNGMLPVAQPTEVGLELRVRSLDPATPSEFYVLEEDGCFHLQQSPPPVGVVQMAEQAVRHNRYDDAPFN